MNTKNKQDLKKKRIRHVVFTGCIVIIMIFLYLYFKQFNTVKFDSHKWKNWKESESELYLRWDMTQYLMKNHTLNGKTKTQIINLLGEPERKSQNKFEYYIGHSRVGWGIDTGTLIIFFNDKDTVINVIIYGG